MSTATLNGFSRPIHDETVPDLPHIADFRKTGKWRYSLARALKMSAPRSNQSGLERETSQELRRQTGRPPRGIYIPWDLPLPDAQYSLTTTTGGGSIPTILAPTLFDALRNKMICARLGARIGDFRIENGQIGLPVKSAAATVGWVQEGVPPASGTNMTVQQIPGNVHWLTGYTDTTRQMLDQSQPGFREFIADDLVGSVAHALDAGALNGTGENGQPLGLCQMPNWPSYSFASGTPTYKGLTAMKRIAGQNNADSAPDARMAWATSNAGREALEQTDLGGSTTTGRYAWKSHVCPNPVTGEPESIESMLGQPAAATESIPSGLSGAGLSNATVLLYGNFRSVFIQVFGPLDVVQDPFLNAMAGTVRFTVFQGADVLVQYPGLSFVSAPIVAPNP